MSLSIARVSGISIPVNKKIYISLCYIFGIGQHTAIEICKKTHINPDERTKNLTEDNLLVIRKYIEENCKIEGDLRAQIAQDIKMKISIGSYQGSRHRFKLTVRGQRTKTNAKTRKGRSKAIANKKKPTK